MVEMLIYNDVLKVKIKFSTKPLIESYLLTNKVGPFVLPQGTRDPGGCVPVPTTITTLHAPTPRPISSARSMAPPPIRLRRITRPTQPTSEPPAEPQSLTGLEQVPQVGLQSAALNPVNSDTPIDKQDKSSESGARTLGPSKFQRARAY